MEIVFLGTGTSQGVPLLAHPNTGLDLSNKKNWRTRCSVHVVMGGVHVQVDAGPDFRWQCLREKIPAVDVLVLTHGHTDHVAGMDDLRRFCELRGGVAIPVYSTREGLGRVREMFPYAIREHSGGSGYAAFSLREMPEELVLGGGFRILSTRLPHGRVETLGLVFEEEGRRFVYYPDCKEVPRAAVALARGADVVVLDGLRPEPHPTHMSVRDAVAVARRVGARRTFITHMTYQVDHERWAPQLAAEGVELAYDGLRVCAGAE
jgi:phosphoribosyl 1,2-cyclic phosphate phosphodiesterase